MKKFLACITVLIFLLSYSYANAALLGISPAGMYPDITVDSASTIVFTPDAGGGGGGSLTFTGTDLIITYTSGGIFDVMGETGFTLTLDVDNTGAMIGTGLMCEVVNAGQTEALPNAPGGSVSYASGTVLLTGEVTAFGWDNAYDPTIKEDTGFFDFIVGDTSGALIDDGIWPGGISIGISGSSEDGDQWVASWWNTTNGSKSATDYALVHDLGGLNEEYSNTLHKAKSDKYPIPEPCTLILLGLGLAGIGVLGWRKRNIV